MAAKKVCGFLGAVQLRRGEHPIFNTSSLQPLMVKWFIGFFATKGGLITKEERIV